VAPSCDNVLNYSSLKTLDCTLVARWQPYLDVDTETSVKQDALGDSVPPPTPLFLTKGDPGFKTGIPDWNPDVCRIVPKMLWIHCHVGVSHVAECHENRPVTVWEIPINVIKSATAQWQGTWKTDPEIVSRTGLPPKVNKFFRLVGPVITPSFNKIGWLG